jgi:deoxycytidylate deaminase
MGQEHPEYLGYHPGAELVFAIVCPLGTPYKRVAEALGNYLGQFGYRAEAIQVSDYFGDLLAKLRSSLKPSGEDATAVARYKILAGNEIRKLAKKNDIMALVAAGVIADLRSEANRALGQKPNKRRSLPLKNTAYIISTVRRPEEVTTLRRIYGDGFFLIGANASREVREHYLEEKGTTGPPAVELMEIDAKEKFDYGQATRDAFQMADVFVSGGSTGADYADQVGRFLDLVFGCPLLTPTPQEQAMFMAYAASLRSGDLSRQVGAAIIDAKGDLISIGCNEVPKFGGGLYDPPTAEKASHRDIEQGEDSNEREKNAMADRIVLELGGGIDPLKVRSSLKAAGFFDITEFGRAVHAEMEALLACARSGRSARGAVLYTTTFPCHNCTRHIIAAGIEKVIYIEPYAKSRASDLHPDAISVDREENGKLPFLSFVGVGPRRYFDLFSMALSTGYPIERKSGGKTASWSRSSAPVRLQVKPTTYLMRERLASGDLKQILSSHGKPEVDPCGILGQDGPGDPTR